MIHMGLYKSNYYDTYLLMGFIWILLLCMIHMGLYESGYYDTYLLMGFIWNPLLKRKNLMGRDEDVLMTSEFFFNAFIWMDLHTYLPYLHIGLYGRTYILTYHTYMRIIWTDLPYLPYGIYGYTALCMIPCYMIEDTWHNVFMHDNTLHDMGYMI